MLTVTLLTTRQVAQRIGVTRQHVARLVREERIAPVATLVNGSYLFDEADYPANLSEATQGASS